MLQKNMKGQSCSTSSTTNTGKQIRAQLIFATEYRAEMTLQLSVSTAFIALKELSVLAQLQEDLCIITSED